MAYQNLITHLGLPPRPGVIWDPMQQVVMPEEDLLQHFDVDTRASGPAPPTVSGRATWGRTSTRTNGAWCVVVRRAATTSICTGARWRASRRGTTWSDSPGPIRTTRAACGGCESGPSICTSKTDYAVVLSLGATLLHTSQYLRGFEGWFMDLALRPEFMHALFDKILAVHVRTIRNVLRAVGGRNIDVAFIADDLTTEAGPMFSPAAYREFLKPRLKQIIGTIREFSEAKILYHCCGAAHHFLDDLIECGVDAINPVQTSAGGWTPPG